jgi:Ca-activated chloride channel family protein
MRYVSRNGRRGRRAAGAALILCLWAAATARAQTREEPDNPPEDAWAFLKPLLNDSDPMACFRDVKLASPRMEGQRAAPVNEPAAPTRIMVAIDSSGSMRAVVGGERKIEAAKTAVRSFLAELPPEIEVGLVVFGHRGSGRADGKDASCAPAGAEIVAEPGRDRAPVLAAVDRARATGWTPLAGAISRAAEPFAASERLGEQAVYVVSDGVETCGGDPVAAARKLRESDVRAIVNIIGFDIAASERAALESVAEAGGGRFLAARTGAEVRARLSAEFENRRRASNAQFEATRARANNQFETTRAISNARFCVNRIISNERFELNRTLSGLRFQGRLDEEIGRGAERLLGSRHEAIGKAMNDYEAALAAANAQRSDDILRDLERALDPVGGAGGRR